jgi:hypothetical protein
MVSDVVMPDTRMPAKSELGSESNAGDINTELAVDEFDEWLAAVCCGTWAEKKRINLKVTAGADVDGSLSLTFPDEEVATVPVTADDTAAGVVAKILEGTYTDWIAVKDFISDDTIVFTFIGTGPLEATPLFDGGASGVEAAFDTAARTEKELVVGNTRKTMYILKKYTQDPIMWKLFKGEQINSVDVSFAVDSYVKCKWNFQGANNPKLVETAPVEMAGVKDVFNTKSFNTRSGFLKVAGTANRQCSSMNLSINNNMESTPALFETEAIEQSLGDLEITGTLNEYFTDGVLYNAAKDGESKKLEIQLTRTVDTKTTKLSFYVNAGLQAPSETGDKKYSHAIPFKVYGADGFKIIKQEITA